jgi:hypothetical protein
MKKMLSIVVILSLALLSISNFSFAGAIPQPACIAQFGGFMALQRTRLA